jgi:hypothetical protein
MLTPAKMRDKARNCRELAMVAHDATAATLRMLADDYEKEAVKLEAEAGPSKP